MMTAMLGPVTVLGGNMDVACQNTLKGGAATPGRMTERVQA